jgi:hypothetical protein
MGRPGLPSLRRTDARDGEFTIVVSYPGGEHCTHDHAVFHGMPVDTLRGTLSSLLQVPGLVSLTVSPTWLALDHGGSITDRVLPGSTIPCPFLEQASEVRVLCPVGTSFALLGASDTTLDAVECISPALDTNEGAIAPPQISTAVEDTSNWGSATGFVPRWGKANPPHHQDEGLEWSLTSDRATRVAWDLRQECQ